MREYCAIQGCFAKVLLRGTGLKLVLLSSGILKLEAILAAPTSNLQSLPYKI